MIKYSKSLAKIVSFAERWSADLEIKNNPATLYDPINYLFSQKGKQIRSILVLLSNNLFNNNRRSIKKFVLAIESLHNFTLIHDDVMDNATLRRGVPTINKKWSINQAVLSGDVLMITAYHHLLKSKKVNNSFLKEFTQTAIKICEGQQLDLDMQNKTRVSLDDYYKMIDFKTGALIQLALTSSCFLTETGSEYFNTMNTIGSYLGRLFQIQDDYLDLYGKNTGKIRGGDICENKKTFLYAVALNSANTKEKEKIETIYHSNQQSKLSEIIFFYDKLKVQKITQKEIEKLSKKIFKLINNINVSDQKKAVFLEFIKIILTRKN